MQNIFSSSEIDEILNHPIVQENKAKVSDAQKMVKFSFPLSDDMRVKLETRLSIHVESTVPMRWIQGDTPAHIDRADEQFSKTHLIYLTNSIGTFIVDGRSHPIVAGEAHVFSEGLQHYTVGTGNIPRLIIGPMSETGFEITRLRIGGSVMGVMGMSVMGDMGMSVMGDPMNMEMSVMGDDDNDGAPVLVGSTNPLFVGTNPNPSLVGTYAYPYPHIAPPRPLVWGSLFTNNSQVYYKSHSLSTGSGGSGVRNVRHKQRKT
jgi:hypothetical protein